MQGDEKMNEIIAVMLAGGICLSMGVCGTQINQGVQSTGDLTKTTPAAETTAESEPITKTEHKSNLDWKASDSDPNDNILVYYRIKPNDDSVTNYRYFLDINFDDDILGMQIQLYENRWSKLEGGRISGRAPHDYPITWTNDEKTFGSVSIDKSMYGLTVKEDKLIIERITGTDDDALVGEYAKAE